MTRFPGLGDRLSERLQTIGFSKDGRPDVGRFCREKGYRPQYVYAWLKDRMPAYDNINRLCADLGVPVVWFVIGAESGPDARVGGRSAHGNTHRRRPGHAEPATPSARLALGSLRDATDRIAALEADFTALLAAFPDPCVWFDDTGRVLEVEGALTGPITVAAKGKLLRDVLPTEAAARLQRAFGQAVRSDDVVTIEYAAPVAGSKRGRTFEARVRPVVERAGRRARKVLAVIRDVTDRRDREHEYQELVEGSANGLCVFAGDKILYANRAMARMLGYAGPNDLLDRPVRDVLPDHRALRPTPGQTISRRTMAAAIQRGGERVQMASLTRSITWRSEPAVLVTLIAPVAG